MPRRKNLVLSTIFCSPQRLNKVLGDFIFGRRMCCWSLSAPTKQTILVTSVSVLFSVNKPVFQPHAKAFRLDAFFKCVNRGFYIASC